MSLPSTQRLTPHFTAFELGADRPEATLVIVSNLGFTAEALERARVVLNVPLQVNTLQHLNRGFRPEPVNATVGGSPTSDHPRGLAADFVPLGYPGGMLSAYLALKAASESGQLGQFDQIIFYPLSGHIHLGIGQRLRNEFRVYVFEGAGGIPLVSADTIKALGSRLVASPALALLAFAVVAIILLA